ncbi:MAG: septum formation initiator family protein [Prevotella sp.]
MEKLKALTAYLRKHTIVKYSLVTVFGVLIVGIFDENSVWNHMLKRQKIQQLEEEICAYKKLNESNLRQLKLLKTDIKAMERIARERYFMKADDEDIFVMNENNKPSETAGNENAEQD